MFASRKSLAGLSQKLSKHALSVPAGILFIILIIQAFFAVHEVILILEDPVENFKNYPFGTELGYSYESQRVYFASAFIHAYIFIQALGVGVLLACLKRKIASSVVLALPLLLFWFTSQNYGALPS